MFSEIMRYILDLGPTVMLPIVIIIFSKLLGMKLGDCFKSGLHIGIGFVGIGLVIGLMLDSIGPAAKAMAEHFQINLHVIDIGWPGSSPMTWASQIALVAIPVAIVVNIVMLVTRMTRVVNVDIWNIWHMTFTGAMLHIATGSYWIGILGVVVHAAFVYKLGDWFAKDTRDFFGLEGIAIPHGSSAYLGPVAVLVDTIIDKIPGLNRIHFSADDIQKRFGPFGEPVTVGFVMGLVIGALAGYDLKSILQLAVKTAAVMLLMPRVIKPIMDGLTPIAKQARKRLQAKFGGQEFLIGLDPALLLGHTSVVSASLIFIPLTILIAVVVPGNQVLPFGDLATIGFFVAIMPLYVLGFMGMTRRLSQQIDPQFHPMLVVAACGAALIACGILCQLIQFYVSIRDRDQNRDLTGDPWGGRTLEWATSSPPPFYNFAIVPQVHERDAFWEMKEKGEAYKQPAHYEEIHMPKNSGAGIVIAAFATVFGFAMIWHIWWMAIASFIGIVATWIIKSFDEDVDYYVPVAEVEKLEKQHFDEINKAGLKNGN